MTKKYQVRQVAAMFVLECQDDNSASYPVNGDYWHILENGHSWEWAERVAAEYRCEII